MTTQNNIGPKRKVVGAHYGFWGWLGQRITACIMIVFTLVLLIRLFFAKQFSYEGWINFFHPQWMKVITFAAFLALSYHAWVGMRNVWMDYVKPVGIRLFLYSITIFWVLACVIYAAQVLWRV